MSYYSGSSSRSNISTKKDYDVVFKSSGSKPLERCLSNGSVSRVYDKTSKGYVLALSGGRSTNVHFPKKKTASLGLTPTRPYLVLQVYVPIGRPFTSEVIISDDKLTRRRLIFSTAFKEELYGELHAQISLQNLERGKWLNLCIDMLSIMDICFENDGKTNFRVCDAITVSSVCKLRNVYVVRENPYGKGGLPMELAFANGVESSYVLYDDQHILERRPVNEFWDEGGVQNDISMYGDVSEYNTPSKRAGGGRGGGITSARRGGGFGEDISGSNTTPQLAFGTRFTPSPSRNKTNAKKKYGKNTSTPPRSVKRRSNRNKNDPNNISLGIKNMRLNAANSSRKTPTSTRKSPAKSPPSGTRSYITPKQSARRNRDMVSRKTSPMVRGDRYDESPQYSVPPATPNTPYESPALKRTPVAQALTLEQTPPPSPVRQRQETDDSMLKSVVEERDEEDAIVQEQDDDSQSIIVPDVKVPSVLYDGSKYDTTENDDILYGHDEKGNEIEFNANNRRKEVNSSLDSDDLYGDVVVISNNNNNNNNSIRSTVDDDNSDVLDNNFISNGNKLAAMENDNVDNISNISLNDDDDDDSNMVQQDNSINAEYEIQFQNHIHGRIDARERESIDVDDEEMEFHNGSENNNVSLDSSDLSEGLMTYGERIDLVQADDEDNESFEMMMEEEIEQQQHLLKEEEQVSSKVAVLSDDLTKKRQMLEEKRRKLLELEQSYMEEFGDENEDVKDDLEVEDIEVNDKENIEANNVIEAVIVKKEDGDVREEEGQITIDSDDADIVNADDNNAMNSSKGGEASVELIYDPVLACYFDPKSGKYYEIQQ